jgi:hypothetical protein
MKRALTIAILFLATSLIIVTASTSIELEVSVIEPQAQFEFGPSWNNNETLVFFAGTAPTVSDPQQRRHEPSTTYRNSGPRLATLVFG